MKSFRFKNLRAWIDHVQLLLRKKDLDNVVVFAGDPGNGKSTFMIQVAKALDDEFSLDRIHYSSKSLINDAKSLAKYRCVAGDEILISRRHAMTAENKEFYDFLQVCRALNLHILLCFPHAAMMDRAILDRRVRFKIEVPEQGIAIIYERHFRSIRDSAGREDYAVVWEQVTPPLRFEKNSGVFWEEYLAKKLQAARQREAEALGFESPEAQEEASPVKVKRGHKRMRDGIGGRVPKLVPRMGEDGSHHPLCGSLFRCPTGEHTKGESYTF